jgi:two-component system OmpR family sensor kinase
VTLRARLVLLFTVTSIVVGTVGGLVLARRLQLGLVSDLDGVLRQRASAVSLSVQRGQPDLTEAEGPVQILALDGTVLVSAGGASSTVPLMNAERRQRAARAVFIVDDVAQLGGHPETVRVLGRPAGNGELVTLAVGRDPEDDVVARTLIEFGLLGIPATVLIALGVWLVTGAALRPVERMRAQAAAASPRDRTVLTVPPGRDELARLAVTLNDLLAAQQAALRAEQSFLADAGHELRTPLAILAGELEYADRPARTEAELRDTVTVAREETTRLVRLAEQLLVLARIDGAGLQRADVDLRRLAGQAVTAWAATARAGGVEFVLRPGEPVTASVDGDRTRQLLDNLLANALRAAPAGSVVEIIVGTSGPAAELIVSDDGPGFPPGFLPQAFERFRTADLARARGGPAVPGGSADSSGTGLGLAVVRRIAEAHGGTATARNRAEGGAVVSVLLPLTVPLSSPIPADR